MAAEMKGDALSYEAALMLPGRGHSWNGQSAAFNHSTHEAFSYIDEVFRSISILHLIQLFSLRFFNTAMKKFNKTAALNRGLLLAVMPVTQ